MRTHSLKAGINYLRVGDEWLNQEVLQCALCFSHLFMANNVTNYTLDFSCTGQQLCMKTEYNFLSCPVRGNITNIL